MRWSRVLLLLGIVAPGMASAQAGDDIAQLRWLAGCWELRSASRVTQEQWMAPSGGVMLGTSRTVVRDAVREYEFLRMARVSDTLRYIAMPSGQRETVFTAQSVTDTLVRFTNQAHDFPQHIEYRRRGADSVVATISGTTGGAARTIPFPMRRIPCGG